MTTPTPFIYQDSFGFRLTLTTNQDLSTTTSLLLKIKRPSDVISKNLTAANISDVLNGVVFYEVVTGDFPTAGSYQLQLIDNTTGRYIPSDIKKLNVKASL